MKTIDKIYVLHLSNEKEREQEIVKEFNKVGILNDVSFWWVCKPEISYKVVNHIPSLTYCYNNNISKGNAFNVTLNHYNIIKTSYERGFNNIIIFEDDIKFLCENNKEWNNILDKIPDDADVCKMLGKYDEQYKDTCKLDENNIPNDLFKKILDHRDFKYCEELCAGAYYLNRTGMKAIIDQIDKSFEPFDFVFNNIADSLNLYVNNYTIFDFLSIANASSIDNYNRFFKIFDKIVFLTLAEHKERIKNIYSTIDKFNLSNSEIYYTTKLSDIDLKCSTLFDSLHTEWYDNLSKNNKYIMANNFNVSRNHLSIIKIAYELGYNSILICEDDIEFVEKNTYIYNLLYDKMNFEYDIIKFSNDEYNGELPEITRDILLDEHINVFSKLNENETNFSTRCYAISRSGMKKYIDWMMETNHLCEDLFFNELLKYYKDNINIYKINYRICPISKMYSTII